MGVGDDREDPLVTDPTYVETLRAFHVHGLWGPDLTLLAEDEADARRLYHVHLPGWDGTVFSVTEAHEDETARLRADLQAEIDQRQMEIDIAESVL